MPTSGGELEVVGGAAQPVAPSAARSARRSRSATCSSTRRCGTSSCGRAQTEMGHSIEAVTRLALAHPHIHFTLAHNGRTMHDLPPVADIRGRIAAFFGDELADDLIEIDSDERRRHAERLRGQPDAQPRDRPDAVPVSQWPGDSRPGAAARAGRSVSRPAAHGPAADRFLAARDAGGAGRRERASDEAGSPLSGFGPVVQPAAGHAADEVFDDRSDSAREHAPARIVRRAQAKSNAATSARANWCSGRSRSWANKWSEPGRPRRRRRSGPTDGPARQWQSAERAVAAASVRCAGVAAV